MATGVKPGGGAAAPEESLWDVDFEKADYWTFTCTASSIMHILWFTY